MDKLQWHQPWTQQANNIDFDSRPMRTVQTAARHLIKNPHYSSLLIQAAVAPHFPTRRPALDTLVTLPGMGYESYAATVVVIEQNHWPTEWAYMIQMEKEGKHSQLIMTILDRGGLNPHDTSTRISPKVMELKKGETAFFFDRYERPIQVTIIEQGDTGFHVTVRNDLRPVPHDENNHELGTKEPMETYFQHHGRHNNHKQIKRQWKAFRCRNHWNNCAGHELGRDCQRKRNSGTIAHGKAHSGAAKEKSAPEGSDTEDYGNLAELHLPMLLLRPAHPSHSAGRHKQKFALPYQGDIDFPELPEGHAEP